MAQRTALLGGAVAVALVVAVEHDHGIDHGHHDAAVNKDGAHVGEGPPRRPEQAEQAGGYQHDGVVDQGHGSLASELDRRRRVIREGLPSQRTCIRTQPIARLEWCIWSGECCHGPSSWK